MQIFNEFNKNPNLSLCMGFFDGVHEGHKVVIKNAVNLARQNGLKSAVITFKDHPLCYLQGRTPQYITSLEDRLALIEQQGVDFAYVLEFDESIADYLAADYLREVLVANFEPKFITTGFNHSFGVNKQGNAEFLRSRQKEFGYKFFEIPPITFNSTLISSTKIRQLISAGELENMKNLLGTPFFLRGEVREGSRIGRSISFPTANIRYPKDILRLPKGVYFATVEVNGKTHNSVVNIGVKPTVSDAKKLLVEAHILDFNENIYTKPVKINFLKKVRNEQCFESINALKNRIAKDTEAAMAFFEETKL